MALVTCTPASTHMRPSMHVCAYILNPCCARCPAPCRSAPQAQHLASVEATMKSPGMAQMGASGPMGVVDMGVKDLQRQVKRLGADVRLLKVIDGSIGSLMGDR